MAKQHRNKARFCHLFFAKTTVTAMNSSTPEAAQQTDADKNLHMHSVVPDYAKS